MRKNFPSSSKRRFVPAKIRVRNLPSLRSSDIEVVITPDDFDHRIDKLGRPYAWVRGVLTYRRTDRFRTVMVQGEAYNLISHLLGVGTSLKIRGFKETIIDRATGKRGGEIFRAMDVIKVYDAAGREIDGSTGKVLCGHERRGHYGDARTDLSPELRRTKSLLRDIINSHQDDRLSVGIALLIYRHPNPYELPSLLAYPESIEAVNMMQMLTPKAAEIIASNYAGIINLTAKKSGRSTSFTFDHFSHKPNLDEPYQTSKNGSDTLAQFADIGGAILQSIPQD